MLLEEVVELFIQIPFKNELFKQLTTRISSAEVPTLPLLIKVMQSLIALGIENTKKANEIRRPFMPCLGNLINSLTKVPYFSFIYLRGIRGNPRI